jgi:hypothetical protein
MHGQHQNSTELATALQPLGTSFSFDALAVTLLEEARLTPRDACVWLRDAKDQGRLVNDPSRPGRLMLSRRLSIARAA